MIARLLKKWRDRRLMRRINEACDAASRRVSKMGPEERAELNRRALKTMFPDGYWTCNHGPAGVYVGAGKECPICAKEKRG